MKCAPVNTKALLQFRPLHSFQPEQALGRTGTNTEDSISHLLQKTSTFIHSILPGHVECSLIYLIVSHSVALHEASVGSNSSDLWRSNRLLPSPGKKHKLTNHCTLVFPENQICVNLYHKIMVLQWTVDQAFRAKDLRVSFQKGHQPKSPWDTEIH